MYALPEEEWSWVGLVRCFLELREGVAERARTMFDIYEREQVCDNLAVTQECYNTPDLCNVVMADAHVR